MYQKEMMKSGVSVKKAKEVAQNLENIQTDDSIAFTVIVNIAKRIKEAVEGTKTGIISLDNKNGTLGGEIGKTYAQYQVNIWTHEGIRVLNEFKEAA